MIAIRQKVTVGPDGLVEFRAPSLTSGDEAEVIVLVERSEPADSKPSGRKTWRDYAGTFNSGDPDSANNERIDADLARELLDNHEPGQP